MHTHSAHMPTYAHRLIDMSHSPSPLHLRLTERELYAKANSFQLCVVTGDYTNAGTGDNWYYETDTVYDCSDTVSQSMVPQFKA